jgi:hypothetical protein
LEMTTEKVTIYRFQNWKFKSVIINVKVNSGRSLRPSQFWTPAFFFSSPGPKGQVSFCHLFASVVVRVCKLFIFSSSSLKPLNRFGPNLAEMFIWEVLYQIFFFFGADRKSKMAARANNVFWLVEILKIFLS